MMAKLRDVAYGKNSDGEYKEPSRRVREAAERALGMWSQEAAPAEQPQSPTATASADEAEGAVRAASLASPSQDGTGQPPPGQVASHVATEEDAVAPQSEIDLLGIMPRIALVGRQFRLVLFQETTGRPVQPNVPGERAAGTGTILRPVPSDGGGDFFEIAYRTTPVAEKATKEEADRTPSTNMGEFLKEADTVQSVETQRRSPVAFDPHVRGFRWGQIYAQSNGAYWTPARLDLDTMLNKIDPSMIQSVVVVPGPYALRYGPGFAFIDMEIAPTPRNSCVTFDTIGQVRTNGGQLYGRETVSGGGCDWGYRFSYGDRKGSDYESGNGDKVPSSYHNRDAWGQIGYDINPHQHVDFSYTRLDQTDTEYPAQFFDINYLGTYGFNARIVDDDPTAPWTRLAIEGWNNRTWFNGDTSRKNNRSFPVMQRVNWGLDDEFYSDHKSPADPNDTWLRVQGTSRGGEYSTGARLGLTWGDKDEPQLRAGADVRYLGQVITEYYETTTSDPVDHPVPDGLVSFDTNMPHAWMVNPGVYSELSQPMTEEWTVAVGARLDYVRTQSRVRDLRGFDSGFYEGMLKGIDTFFNGVDELQQNDVLYAFYLTSTLKAGDHWTVTAGAGQSQRPPTLIERYADGLFLAVLQSGFTHTIGDPSLAYERNWQIDVGLRADYEDFRGRAVAFHSWVLDYITFSGSSVVVPPFESARLVSFMNTPLATLDGFELYGEYDWTERLTPFAKMSYVEGRDQDLHAPLWGVPPLDGTVGLRLHDPQKGRTWGIEVAVRMVAAQDRLGAIHGDEGPITVEERTPGFALCNLRAYYNYTKKLSLVAGVENLFNRNYQEHLDLRLTGPRGGAQAFPLPDTRVWEPGFSPYFGLNWIF